MSSQTRNKLDVRKFAQGTKIILMTLFAGYAASKCADSLLKDTTIGAISHYRWYHNFLFILKYTYGMISSLGFYMLIFHKYDKNTQ